MKTRGLSVLLATVVVLIAALTVLYKDSSVNSEKVSAYYLAALQSAHITETVSVGGISYGVANGVISPAVGSSTASRVAELAYSKVAAERNPILDLTGVSPEALAASTAQLKAMLPALAGSVDPADAGAVTALYPVHFLDALAELEAARQRFLLSGSDGDEKRYESALRSAAEAGARDATTLADAYKKILGGADSNASVSIGGLSGVYTSASLREEPRLALQRMKEVSETIDHLVRCTHGETSQCAPDALSLPRLESVTMAPLTAAQAQLRQTIEPVIQQSFFSKSKEVRSFLLASSICLAALPPPYPFLAGENTSLFYTGDLYLEPINERTRSQPFTAYMGKTYGMSYLLMYPTQFYHCPREVAELARVRAIAAIANFAQAHPDFKKQERAALLEKNTLSEEHAVAYLRAALAQQADSPDEYIHDIIRLALMYNNRTAGLDTIVSQIAFVNSNHVAAMGRGVPFDLTVRVLFLTHSALESLYLTDNPSAGTTVIPINVQKSDDLGNYFNTFRPYSFLQDTLPTETLLHDIRASVSFEGR